MRSVPRRRPATRGFALTEALVALAIAALTITLLIGSSWGLATANERRATIADSNAVDWLAARRVLLQWASAATTTGGEETERWLTGTAATARVYVEPASGNTSSPFVGALEVVALGDGVFALNAARYGTLRDARLSGDASQRTEILRTTAPIRILYYFERGRGLQSGVWRYEAGGGTAGLPRAIGIEVGDVRRVTAPIFADLSAACVARLGLGGLEEEGCELR